MEGDAAESTESTYKASAKASGDVGELLAADAEDESLKRYKEQLLGAAANGDLGDASDPRQVIGVEFRVIFEDSDKPDAVMDMQANETKQSFSMIEGSVDFSNSVRITS